MTGEWSDIEVILATETGPVTVQGHALAGADGLALVQYLGWWSCTHAPSGRFLTERMGRPGAERDLRALAESELDWSLDEAGLSGSEAHKAAVLRQREAE